MKMLAILSQHPELAAHCSIIKKSQDELLQRVEFLKRKCLQENEKLHEANKETWRAIREYLFNHNLLTNYDETTERLEFDAVEDYIKVYKKSEETSSIKQLMYFLKGLEGAQED